MMDGFQGQSKHGDRFAAGGRGESVSRLVAALLPGEIDQKAGAGGSDSKFNE